MPQTWTDVWATVTERLGDSTEARHLIEAASGQSGASWLILAEAPVPAGAIDRVDAMVARRLAGEPLQYVVGHWAFRELELKVDARALIPRPETEELVEAALPFIKDQSTVIDLGTGTGAIALAIKNRRPGARVIATDASAEALSLARDNAGSLTLTIEFRHGSWFEALEPHTRADVIVSNPPYVEASAELDRSVMDHEPHRALFAGVDGLDDIRILLSEGRDWLVAGGKLFMEMHPPQVPIVEQLARDLGWTEATHGLDITGRARWVVATA